MCCLVSRFGYTDTQWSDARREITEILRGRARQEPADRLLRTGVGRVTSISLPHHGPAINAMLEEVSETRGLGRAGHVDRHWSFYKEGEMRPGDGFYDLAKSARPRTSPMRTHAGSPSTRS